MKVKTLIANVGEFDRKAGEVIEVSKEVGERLIEAGHAEEVKTQKQTPKGKEKEEDK